MRRNTGRGRRTGGSVAGQAYMFDFDFQAANLSKTGGNLITSVTNQRGALGAIVQGNGARQPLWVNNGDPTGTRDVARFTPDGTNFKQLTNTPAAALFGLAGYTVFLVLNRTAGAAAHLLCQYNNGAVRGGWSLEFSGTTTRNFQARTSAGTVKTATFGTYTNGTPEIWTVRNVGANDSDSSALFSTRVNGAAVAWTGSPWFWIPTAHAFNVGITASAAGPDLLVMAHRGIASYLTDEECLAHERELGARYGIAVP